METLTNKEAVEFIGCSRDKFQKWARDKKILPAGRKNAKSLLYLKSDVQKLKREFLKRNPKKMIAQSLPEIKQTAIEKQDQKNLQSIELNDIGKNIMCSVTDELKALGLYRESDNLYIRDYAHNYQLYHYFTQLALEQNGVQYGKGGVLMLSPYLKIADNYAKTCETMRKNLGLNPLARQKLTIEEKKELDDMSELFTG